jgi:NCS1 family nucleobase:cation symporter-1
MDETGKYWYTKGYNKVAVIATVVGAVLAVIPVLLGGTVYGMHTAAQYSWFIGCGVAFGLYYLLARRDALVAESVS